MIKGFEPRPTLEPEGKSRMQWGPALGAGLIAGIILLVVPRGSPWASLTFFTPVIMGRPLPGTVLPMPVVWLIHLGVSLLYGLVISRFVAGVGHRRAFLAGGIVGLILYVINWAVVTVFWPEVRGNQFSVVFTHVVFGLIAAGAYRGLLRRRPIAVPPGS